jgi:hypothetical protein
MVAAKRRPDSVGETTKAAPQGGLRIRWKRAQAS